MKALVRLAAIAVAMPLLSAISACGGGGGSATPPTPVVLAPTVNVSISAPSVWQGDTATLTWSSTNSTSCSGQDSISGIKPISGSEVVTATSAGQLKFTISCDGAGGMFKQTVTLTSNPKTATFTSVVAAKSANADALGYEPANVNGVKLGDWFYNTGIWGIPAASQYYEKQIGTVDYVNSTNGMVIEWDIVSSDKPAVVIFGNMTYGKHPGATISSTTKLPAKVDSFNSMKITGKLETLCLTTCGYQTTFDVFLMSSPNSTVNDKGTELMITAQYDGPFGGENPNGTVTIDGIEFNVFHNSFGSTWNTIVYAPKKSDQFSNVDLDLKKFIDDSKARGYISGSEYLVSIELGTEVVVGKGTTTVTNMKIN